MLICSEARNSEFEEDAVERRSTKRIEEIDILWCEYSGLIMFLSVAGKINKKENVHAAWRSRERIINLR